MMTRRPWFNLVLLESIEPGPGIASGIWVDRLHSNVEGEIQRNAGERQVVKPQPAHATPSGLC